MSQRTFASNASPALPNLDLNFSELYGLRELISDPNYTASTPKVTFDANYNLLFNITANANNRNFVIGGRGAGAATYLSIVDPVSHINEVLVGMNVAQSRSEIYSTQFPIACFVLGAEAWRVDTARNFLIGRAAQASGGMLEVSGGLVFLPPSAAPTLGVNGDVAFQRVSNTSLKILMRGNDGTTRSVTLTLA